MRQQRLPLPQDWHIGRVAEAERRARKARKAHKARRRLDARAKFYRTIQLKRELGVVA